MNTYLVDYYTNYGLHYMIINAESIEEAKKIALENGAWDDLYCDLIEQTEKGIQFSAGCGC